MAGRSSYSQQMTQSMMAKSQAKDTDLQALQLSERRREELNAGMAAYNASRAARGLSLDTPSAMAVEREIRRQSVRDENVEKYGLTARSSALRLQSRLLKKSAKMSLIQGYVAGGEKLAEGVADAISAVG